MPNKTTEQRKPAQAPISSASPQRPPEQPMAAEPSPISTAVLAAALNRFIVNLSGSTPQEQQFFLDLTDKLRLFSLSEAAFAVATSFYGYEFPAEEPEEYRRHAEDMADLYRILDSERFFGQFIQDLLLFRRTKKRALLPEDLLRVLMAANEEFDSKRNNAEEFLRDYPALLTSRERTA